MSYSSSMLGSQSLVLATTAMVLSSTVLFLAFSRQKPDTSEQEQPLRSCLCSGSDSKKLGHIRKKGKKRVKFAESVKEPKNDGVEFRKRKQKGCKISSLAFQFEFKGMPANRAALYTGILRDRAHRSRMECSSY